MRLGDDVLMLHGNDRHVQSDHAAGLAREIAARRDDVLADDLTLVGDDLPFPAAQALDRDDAGLAVDLAAAASRPARQRLGQIGGLDIAVLGVLDRAYDALDIAQRPDFFDLARGQKLHVDAADGRGDAGVIMVFVHPVARACEANVGDKAQADVEAGLFAEAPVEGDRILMDLAYGIAEVEQRQQTRRVPSGARGQLLAFDEDAVAPAFLDEMVERRDADDPAANDYRPRMRSHVPHSSLCQAPRSIAPRVRNSFSTWHPASTRDADRRRPAALRRGRDRAPAARIRRASSSTAHWRACAASFDPSSCHCSTELLSAMLER